MRTWTAGCLPAVVDASPAKQGLRMPGTDIPVAGPARLAERKPDAVLLFVPDLLAEVREAYPEVEAAGGRWVDAETLGSGSPAAGRVAGPGIVPRVGPMLPIGQPELVGYLGVGHRRIGHEHLEQPLPSPGQVGHRVADDLRALVGEKALVDLRARARPRR